MPLIKKDKDSKYFNAVMNSLVHMFDTNKSIFKFYIVTKGRLTGIFATWAEVLGSIQENTCLNFLRVFKVKIQ